MSVLFFFFKKKTAYEMRISDWSSDVCSSDLFQPGVPAQDAFPAKLWARLRTRAMRETAIAPVGRRDPRGAPELRAQIAAQIAITRGIRCVPDQIILTSGPRKDRKSTRLNSSH